ncbi:hypothetical protein C8C83_2732 [Flavobacterium sp. 90]|uniref:hypothetical protein n=1 Tax=unclassified Flavobacterium TaxID=196869 RepID=UPI000EAEFEA6|nr:MULTISPECIES: hypothetical protein [unclassified Flavobacterium]RKR11036.1 hypothetical protein C8C82_3040 [Flavobacterium sp. 81]TCK54819.1 hypothetical protein C8C83_2732 [Flavobacterium sp. 90]
MKVALKTLFFTIIILQFFSCNNSKKEIALKTELHKSSDKASEIVENDPVKDEFSFPVDSALPVKIIRLETFHSDEIEENYNKKVWFGLFKNNNDYSLAETKVSFKRVNDPIIDETDEEKTGWEVSAQAKDSCLILIEKLPYFIDGNISSVKIPESIYPDESFKFSYKNAEYTLFATGKKKKEQSDSDWIVVSNYKLYLKMVVDGKETTELLVAKKNFDDQMIRIIFAGDLDDDNKLDLIIDTASHYNVSSPTLYLSKPAEKGKAIKPVGVFVTVGC